MWRVVKQIPWEPVLIGMALGWFIGWLLTWVYYRQRMWVLHQRLWDYAERRSAFTNPEDKRLICPVCRSRSLHRSNRRSVATFIGILLGRAPYRCERCFNVSIHRAPWLNGEGKRVDSYDSLDRERRQFAEDLQ